MGEDPIRVRRRVAFSNAIKRSPPPHELALDMVADGVLSPEDAGLPPETICACSHQKGAHASIPLTGPDGANLGPCEAKPCRKFGRCDQYRQDPRYAHPKRRVREMIPLTLTAAALLKAGATLEEIGRAQAAEVGER